MSPVHYDYDDGRVTCQGKNCPVLRVTNCHVSRGHMGSGTFNVETMDMFCVKQVSDYFYPDVIEILEAVRDGVQSAHPAGSAANTNMRIDVNQSV